MEALPLVPYLAAAVFVVAVAVRAIRIASLPMHVRWELYPVAHEKGRAHYGGSYLENPDWWLKKRESSKAGELKVMIPEILLLSAVREHNRSHWYLTFPFHFGLYLLAGTLALLIVGGIASSLGVDLSGGGGAVTVLHHLTYVVGYAGLGLALIGSLALLGRRMFNPDYAEYTAAGDYFNLLFFVVTLGLILVGQLTIDPDFSGMRAFFQRLVTFDLSGRSGVAIPTSPLFATEIVLASVLLAYIPLTHMAHFFTKWFMYHDIRWGDEPNLKGGKMEKKIHEMLNYPVSWSAPHIRGDGKKTWAQVATEGVEEKSE